MCRVAGSYKLAIKEETKCNSILANAVSLQNRDILTAYKIRLMNFSDTRKVDYDELRKIIDSLSLSINATSEYYPTFDHVRGDATPNIEIDKIGYYYVISERGNEHDRRFTLFLDQLLFWIFKDITHQMALDYASNNRIYNQDFRIQLFSHHIDLMTKIKPEFGDMIKKDYEFFHGKDFANIK